MEALTVLVTDVSQVRKCKLSIDGMGSVMQPT